MFAITRITIDSISPTAAVLTLNPAHPMRLTRREDFTTGAPDPSAPVHTIHRREGQAILCGNPWSPLVTIEVASIRQDRVRLSFTCESSVNIHRREIADTLRGNNPP